MTDRRGVRGSPFLQVVLMAVAFALVGLPVWRLTRPDVPAAVSPAAATTPAADVPAAAPAALALEAVFAPAPADFDVKYLDATVLAGGGPQSRFRAPWAATVPADGADLVVRAHWPAPVSGAADAPAAVRLTLRYPDGRQVEKSFWAAANGTLAEVFTVPGASSAPTP